MRKVVASAWITLDGVFDAASMPEWFLPYHTDERGKIISEWIMACDTYLLGRTTYEMLAPHWSALNGKRYFKDGMHTAGLKLVRNETLDSGVIFLCYETRR